VGGRGKVTPCHFCYPKSKMVKNCTRKRNFLRANEIAKHAVRRVRIFFFWEMGERRWPVNCEIVFGFLLLGEDETITSVEHLQRCLVCDPAKIFFTFKFSYVLFCNPHQ